MNLREYEELVFNLSHITKYKQEVSGAFCMSDDNNSPILDDEAKSKIIVIALSPEVEETIEKLYEFSKQLKESK
jgi:hypothetical protein